MDRVAESRIGVLYDSYYPPALSTGAALERDLANPTFTSRRRHIESAIGSLPKRIFEVGCGDGNFLLTMKRAGWVVGGSEHGATAQMTAERHAIPVTSADVLHARPSGAPFSAVAAYHVLEHIYHPAAWMHAIREMIVPGGILHLQVPNFDSLARPLTGEGWASWRFPQHVYFYTPRTLAAFLERLGFAVEHSVTWDPWHGPGTAADSIAHRVRALLGGRSPWDAEVRSRTASPSPEAVVKRPSAARRMQRAGLMTAGTAWSRIESMLGRGAVVDVIARRRDDRRVESRDGMD
jgi:hypothetical protein